jgi:hypothetical protein
LTPLQTCLELAPPGRTRALLLLLEEIEQQQQVRSLRSRCPRLMNGGSGSRTSIAICLHGGHLRGLKAVRITHSIPRRARIPNRRGRPRFGCSQRVGLSRAESAAP